jgi:hypothetical protein
MENGGRLFRRPKLTLSCSTEGKEARNLQQPAPVRALTASDKTIQLFPGSVHGQHKFLVIFIFTTAQKRAKTSKYAVDS